MGLHPAVELCRPLRLVQQVAVKLKSILSEVLFTFKNRTHGETTTALESYKVVEQCQPALSPGRRADEWLVLCFELSRAAREVENTGGRVAPTSGIGGLG